MKHTWTDETGDDGEIEVINNRLFAILGKDSPCFIWTIPTARALHEALGRALEEVDPRPVTDSISATLAVCSASAPEILSRMCTANQRVTVEACADGMPVYKVPETLRGVSVEELARLGLKPSQPTQYEMRCGKCDRALHIGTESDPEGVFGEDYDRQPCWLCGESLLHVTVKEQKGKGENPSQPEPPPTGNGDLVTPSLIEALADYPELTVLVKDRNAFRRTHNGRDPLEDARQELGDLLQYLWQAKMEGRDIHPFLDLWSKAYSVIFPHDERDKRICKHMLEYVEAVRDVTTGSKPESRARADELYAAISHDMLEGDPRMSTVERMHEMMGPVPTLHPRPFWWDFDDGRFVAVDGGHNYLGIETVDDLLEHIPNALNGLESKYPRDAHELPSFGFRREHTGPRTLREYLEAP